jgi:hypothetical protein
LKCLEGIIRINVEIVRLALVETVVSAPAMICDVAGGEAYIQPAVGYSYKVEVMRNCDKVYVHGRRYDISSKLIQIR